MSKTTTQIAAAAVALVSLVTFWMVEDRAQMSLRDQNRALQQQVQQMARSGAEDQPPARVAAQTKNNPALSEEEWRELLQLRGELRARRQQNDELGRLQADNRRLHLEWFEQLLGGKKLSLSQVAPYLEAKQRSAESLLAASCVTGDPACLQEAVAKFPNDARVNLAAHYAFKKESSPEERRQRLDAFEQLAPDNALANYLSAQDYFKAGQTDRAVQEIVAAFGKPEFQDYSGDFMAGAEEAYQAAGLSIVEAKTLAMCAPPLPHMADLRGLGQSLGELANQSRQAGDEASAQAALQMGVALGRLVGESSGASLLIQDLVGIAIERQALEAMNPASPYGGTAQTVQERLGELVRRRETIKEVARDGSSVVLEQLSEQDQLGFFERMKDSGELAALRWARNKQGNP